jgi:hypothetical protein
MPSLRIRSAAGALSAALLLAPLAAAAQTTAWDQPTVAKLAADLAKACIAIYDEFYSEQGINPKIGSGDAGDQYRVRHKLQRLQEESMGLAGALAAGRGKDATITRVEDLGEISRDLKVLLARMFVEAPLTQRIDAARAIWVRILPYYGISAPSDAAPKSAGR